MQRLRAALLFACGAVACGTSRPKELPSTTEPLDGFQVSLDVRTSSYQNGEIIFDALAKNDEPKSLIGLGVHLSVRAKDGSELRSVDVDAIGMRASLSVLEPHFDVPIHVRVKVDGPPASVVARIASAERFAAEPDAPETLAAHSQSGADTSGLEFVSFGHFRIDSVGDPGSVPFRATLGIRNTGHETVKRLDYGIAFTDEKNRDVDRIPRVLVFDPPLRPGDAILEPVSGSARPYAHLSIDVRSMTKGD